MNYISTEHSYDIHTEKWWYTARVHFGRRRRRRHMQTRRVKRWTTSFIIFYYCNNNIFIKFSKMWFRTNTHAHHIHMCVVRTPNRRDLHTVEVKGDTRFTAYTGKNQIKLLWIKLLHSMRSSRDWHSPHECVCGSRRLRRGCIQYISNNKFICVVESYARSGSILRCVMLNDSMHNYVV